VISSSSTSKTVSVPPTLAQAPVSEDDGSLSQAGRYTSIVVPLPSSLYRWMIPLWFLTMP
jgi:hypothetical protein